jgi:heterodisulfide reductase subunit A2
MTKKIVIIGGGIAGMESAAYLNAMGYDVSIIEKESKLGGHLLNWERLFPTKRLGSEVLSFLNKGIAKNVHQFLNTEVAGIKRENKQFDISLSNNKKLEADSIIVATGYDLFNAAKKEEYGYGIYNNVITSAELEKMLLNGGSLKISTGVIPKRVGFIHCVGSRDEKVGNLYCSKVCCVTAVKQSTELKERYPDLEIFCFYMDMRMYGRGFEELYKESQEKYGVQFIRGRLSEACENKDGSILVKVEDTLAGRPLKMSVDLLVLMVGFVPSEGTRKIANLLNLNFDNDGFLKAIDEHTMTNVSNIPGVFLAGTCTGPRTITNTITDARAAAAKVAGFLEGYDIEERLAKIIS